MDWLEWSGRLNRNRQALERIVALLFALAVLAERAAGLPGARRQTTLGILGYAEAEARAYVIAMSRESGASVEPAADTALAHGQAERLAASFRALALILGAMLVLARRFSRLLPSGSGLQAGWPTPLRRSVDPARPGWVAAFPAPDTS